MPALNKIAKHNDIISGLIERIRTAENAIESAYLKKGAEPWVIAYSGGKDSTLLLQLVWEMLVKIPEEERKRKVYVIANDTLVESPLVIKHLSNTFVAIEKSALKQNLPFEFKITKPNVDQTFWVNVIGRGYIPPTRNFRWCTDRMKILPTNRLIKNLIANHKAVILLIGTRKSESISRKRNMDRHGVSSRKMNPHSTIEGCYVFTPIADIQNDDVWITLMQRPPPWGGTHRDLITLYRNAKGGECPLVMSKDDAPSCGTGSPRFGCWTCTVIQKDSSLEGLIDSGYGDTDIFSQLFDFRERLIELREDKKNRQSVRRNGSTKYRPNGNLVMGPFTLDIRKKILDELLVLQKNIDQRLISESEIDIIRDIWRRDKIAEDCRTALVDGISH